MDSGYASGNQGAGYPPQYPPQSQYPPQQPYPPQPHYQPYQGNPHYGLGPNYAEGQRYGYGPEKNVYGPVIGSNPAPGFNQPPQYNQRQIPDTAHMHPLFQEPSQQECKVCKRIIGGGPAYVCHQCSLVLCFDCFNTIFYGNKLKQIHPHPLGLRVRPSWRCDICQRTFRGTASFYCRGCDFDACSNCYVGY